MSAPTTNTDSGAESELTTADFAVMARSGTWDSVPQRDSQPAQTATAEPATVQATTVDSDTSSEKTPATTTKKAVTSKKKNNTVTVEQGERQKQSTLLDGANWIPSDYGSVTPAPLRDVVGNHRPRCQAIGSAPLRLLYQGYAATATVTGVGLNVTSYSLARLSTLVTAPRGGRYPYTLNRTVQVHHERARNIRHAPGKVLYCGYATVSVPTAVGLNMASWAAAHTAVAVNCPQRVGRVGLGVLFLVLVVTGLAVAL